MKKIISILILCSLSLTFVVLATSPYHPQHHQDYEDIKVPIGKVNFFYIPENKIFDHLEILDWKYQSKDEQKPEVVFTTYSSENTPTFTEMVYEYPYDYEILKKGGEDVLRLHVPRTYYKSGKRIDTEEISVRIYYESRSEPKRLITSFDPENPDYDYVIITNETLWQTFYDEFYSWKISNDPKISSIYIVNVSTITANSTYWVNGTYGDATNTTGGNPWIPDGKEVTFNWSIFNDSQAQIRNFIRDYYDNHNTRYVLLGGNKDAVPVRQVATCASGDGCGTYDNDWSHASDMYYSNLDYCMNNVSFEYFMQSECCGYGFDEVDWGFDVYVGRVLVSNVSGAYNWIGKTKNYTNGDNVGDYLASMICCAKDIGNSITDDTWLDLGGEYSASIYRQVQPISNMTWVNGQNISQAQWDIMDDYCNGDVSGWYGIHMILAAGHGDYHSGRLWDQYHPWICDNGDVPNFVNSESCKIGAFGTTTVTCVEDWMQYNSCMFGGVINSAFGWFGASTFFVEDFLEEMFNQTVGNQTLQFSKALQVSKENQGHTLYDGVWAMIYKEANFFGDPALEWMWYGSTFPPQGSDIEFTSIDDGTNGTYVYSSTPTFNWSKATGASKYQLQISNDSVFSDLVINLSNVSEFFFPSYYSENSTTVSFTLPSYYELPYFNKLYYCRVRAYVGGS